MSGDAAPPSGGAALQGATLVAVLTSYLSYPLTLAQALTQQGTGPGGGALARAVAAALPPAPSRGAPQEGPGREGRGQAGASAGPGGAPASGADVVVTVLGASEGAELAHLDVWKVCVERSTLMMEPPLANRGRPYARRHTHTARQ